MRKIDNLLFFYELYLEGLDERNLLQWSMVLDVRSEIEKYLKRKKEVPSAARRVINRLDEILKRKLSRAYSYVNFERLREMQFPKPSPELWWYYPEHFSYQNIHLQTV
ncbi:hypothetical protein [Desulfurobacterium indicum]|nr:hypothetical protein [Desulfurobacterium indicum]